MDLIYMNSNKEDVGVMKDYTLDLAFGSDENDFECTVVSANHCCEEDFFLYIEGTEYGGIIDEIQVDTDKDEITYSGRTWHGILDSKIFEPDAGEDYLVLDGEANTVLAALIERMGLEYLFSASSEDSGVEISSYQMNRYIEGYTGIKKMLKASSAKLNMSFKKGFVELSAKPIVDYSKDEQFDRDQLSFVVKKKENVVNHVICLGQGELAEREVIHVYADEDGNISATQVFTGLDEVTTVYENTSTTDSEELRNGGVELLKNAWASDEIDFSFDSDAESYDIGDIVGAKEYTTGAEVSHEITKKIVKIENGSITISYPKDTSSSGTTSVSSSSGGESSGGSGSISTTDLLNMIYPVGSIYMSVNNVSPAVFLGGTWEPWGTGRVPVGVDTSDSNFSTVEKTGGASDVTLTTAQIPSHTHTGPSHTHSVGAHSHGLNSHTHSIPAHSHGLNSHTHSIPSLSGTAASAGAHQHGIKYSANVASGSAKNHINSGGSGSSTAVCTSAGAHTHDVTTKASTTGAASGSTANSSVLTSGAASGSTANSTAFETGSAGTGNTGATGSGNSHANLQPYITCYMWKRSA